MGQASHSPWSPYRGQVIRETPSLPRISSTAVPRSACHNAKAICSSVYRFRFMAPFPKNKSAQKPAPQIDQFSGLGPTGLKAYPREDHFSGGRPVAGGWRGSTIRIKLLLLRGTSQE